MRIAFVTNFCPYYRVRTFELLARRYAVTFYFYSRGQEKYWLNQHGVSGGRFDHEYLARSNLSSPVAAARLASRLWSSDYELVIAGLAGYAMLPVSYLVTRLKGVRFILWTGVWHDIDTVGHRLLRPWVNRVYRNADAILTYGKHVNAFLLDKKVREDIIFLARHAADHTHQRPDLDPQHTRALRMSLSISDDQAVILYVGRLVAEKGLDYLLDALARLRHRRVVLILAGTGGGAERLAELSGSLGLADRVRFVGYISREILPRYYAIATVCVVPSVTTARFREPWGLVVNEAFYQGVPVVATDAVGAAAGGLVAHGETGFVVPERSPADLSAALDRVITDRDLRDRLGVRARQRVQDYTHEAMVSDFSEAIESVVSRQDGLPASAGKE